MRERRIRNAVAALLCAVMVFASPAMAFAAETANNMQELAKIVTKYGLQRQTSFDVQYTGKQSDIDDLFANWDWGLFFSTMALEDDPATSDDADYLIGNLNFSKAEEWDLWKDENGVLHFTLKYFEPLWQTQYVNQHVPQILSQLGVASMSNYNKVKTIHDYVCNLITYQNSGADEESTMYGALANHKALCNSYSLCMYKLLVEAGVPCKYIGGSAGTGRDAGGHAWNIVALGDRWYNLDATWDDREEDGISYDYFLRGSSDFDGADPSQIHTMDPPYTKAPYTNYFSISTTSFDPRIMEDENHTITIGGTAAPEQESRTISYKLSDIVDGKYPASGKFAVKKNKTGELQLSIRKGKENLVDKVTYKVLSGKSNIKNIKNYGICEDEGEYFTAFTFKGKKNGKVSIKINLKLISGQTISYTFKGCVK